MSLASDTAAPTAAVILDFNSRHKLVEVRLAGAIILGEHLAALRDFLKNVTYFPGNKWALQLEKVNVISLRGLRVLIKFAKIIRQRGYAVEMKSIHPALHDTLLAFKWCGYFVWRRKLKKDRNTMKPLYHFRQKTAAIVTLIVANICLHGCTKAQDSKPENKTASTAENLAANAMAEKKFEDFDANNFTQPTQIGNQWMPMKPGTRYVYEGTTVEDDGTVVPHRVEINVTDMTKTIAGVRSVTTWDLDYSDGELVEAELAFFAQDDSGNVWRMGEYPEEYDEGKFLEAPTWIHGLEEARAGIMMQAAPQPGTPSYSQGWGPAVDWTDRGRVDQMGQKASVPAGNYEDVLVIAETSLSEPEAQQLKYFAANVGNVKVGWRGAGEKTKETLELTKLEQLDAKAMAEVRKEALKMEKHAYEVSKNVYAQTPPLEQAAGGQPPTSK